jgi:hypothetical protein
MNRRRFRPTWVAAAVAILALSGLTAQAEGARAEIVLVGDADRTHALGAAIADLLGPDALNLAWSYRPRVDLEEILRPLPAGAAAARVWVDVVQPTRVHIYLADVSATRFAARSVPVESLDLATHETVAQIVRSSLRALLDAGTPALTRGEMKAEVETRARAESPAPPPAPLVLEAPAATAVEGRLGWLGASTLADGPLAQGAWLTLSLVGRGPGAHPSLWAAGGYGFPWVIEDPALGAGARLSSWGVRAGLALDFALAPWARGRVGVGAGIDRIHVAPQAHEHSAAVVEGDVSLGVVRGSIGVSVPIYRRISALVLLHAELTPRLTFSVASGGDSTALTASRFVRPALEAAIGWEF